MDRDIVSMSPEPRETDNHLIIITHRYQVKRNTFVYSISSAASERNNNK